MHASLHSWLSRASRHDQAHAPGYLVQEGLDQKNRAAEATVF
jgi:hypothetical protein